MKKPGFIVLLIFCLTTPIFAGDVAAPALIPAPVKMTRRPGQFTLQPDTVIVAEAAALATGQYLADQLHASTGYQLKLQPEAYAATGTIQLLTDGSLTNLGPEGYEMTVMTNAIIIRAPASAGLFYGVQTLFQLLPPEILANHISPGTTWTVPCVQIEDQPRFVWRGFMVDVSRHFFTVAEVKTLLDAMALRKMNLFHWHLVDDHGWRIEIKKYPKLTQIGAWRNGIGFNLDANSSSSYGPDGRYGGFYTQDEIREVVAYAAVRHITILPEIEMPGHSLAALSAYPQFTCSGEAPVIPSQLGIFNGIYCTGKDGSYEFLQNIMTEVFALFPTKYIHIGGDEVPTNNWAACPEDQAVIQREGMTDANQLESYFIRRMEKFIAAHGHTLVGWSEIMHGGLATNAVVMDWIGGAEEAARAGHDVVMASEKSLYLCSYPSLDRPPALHAYRVCLPLSKVYAFEPVPATLEPSARPHILGAEACLWTPDVGGMRDAELMIFPRLSAVAEVDWSPAAARDWDDFSRRLPAEYRRLEAADIRYWRDTGVEIGRWQTNQIRGSETTLTWDATSAITVAGKYRLSFNFLKGENGLSIHSVSLLADGHEVASDTHPGYTGTRSRSDKPATDWNYFFDLPALKPGAHYTIQASVTGAGSNACSGVVFLGAEPADL